jgi:protein-S-isoprenylcysteine O-methyltransferase Ste14
LVRVLDVKAIVRRAAQAAASIVVYLPVIAGILTPMVWLLPAWYLSWNYAAYIFPFGSLWNGFILLDLSPGLSILLSVAGDLVLVSGLLLFVYGVVEMARKRRAGVQLVQTGPYFWVRHPQHLGILLLLLPLSLGHAVLGLRTVGIRPGDVLSWTLMAFILLAIADYEESVLSKKLGDAYDEYASSVGFIVPFLPKVSVRLPESLRKGQPLRYIAMFGVFYLAVCAMLAFLTALPTVFIR